VASGLTATGPFSIVKALRPLLPSETLRSVTVKYSPEREGSACEVCVFQYHLNCLLGELCTRPSGVMYRVQCAATMYI
jgi:hypothetical protein